MQYSESKGNLFDANRNCALVHCISSDFVMGAGIAKQFSLMGVKAELLQTYPQKWDGTGYCLHSSAGSKTNEFPNGVFNLITKERYFHKPTYDTLRQSLEDMKQQCEALGIKELAMPLIGCGLDRLQWDKVSQMVQDMIRDTGINIHVVVFEKSRDQSYMMNR